MLNLQTKFEVFRCTRYEAMNGGTKCRKLWWFGVTQDPSAMSPLDRAHTTSYSTLIKKLCVYRVPSYLSKVADFNPPHLHLAPPEG